MTAAAPLATSVVPACGGELFLRPHRQRGRTQKPPHLLGKRAGAFPLIRAVIDVDDDGHAGRAGGGRRRARGGARRLVAEPCAGQEDDAAFGDRCARHVVDGRGSGPRSCRGRTSAETCRAAGSSE